MEIKEKIDELNKEFLKYSNSVVKLLNDSLKEGEYFIFTKLKDNSGYGLVISRERENLINLSNKTRSSKLLDILEENTTGEWKILKAYTCK